MSKSPLRAPDHPPIDEVYNCGNSAFSSCVAHTPSLETNNFFGFVDWYKAGLIDQSASGNGNFYAGFQAGN